jgi:hypothetical protein
MAKASKKSKAARARAGVGSGRPRKSASPIAADRRTAQRPSAIKVMGMRIPRALTNALDSLVNSPTGREILGSAIVAAATAAAAALVESSNKAEAAKARGAASDAGDRISKDLSEAAAGVVAGVISGAAQSLLPALAGTRGKKTTER